MVGVERPEASLALQRLGERRLRGGGTEGPRHAPNTGSDAARH